MVGISYEILLTFEDKVIQLFVKGSLEDIMLELDGILHVHDDFLLIVGFTEPVHRSFHVIRFVENAFHGRGEVIKLLDCPSF